MKQSVQENLTVLQAAKKLYITGESARAFVEAREASAVKIAKWRMKPEDMGRFTELRTNSESSMIALGTFDRSVNNYGNKKITAL